jgi:hypothetical protein
MMDIKKLGRIVATAAVVGSLAACDSLLEVEDPSRFTDTDLDLALDAVANGVEGSYQVSVDYLFNNSAILSDEMEHTGTWAGWDDQDHGRIRYDQDGRFDGGGTLMRSRFAGWDALARFDRLEGEGETIDPALRVQVNVAIGWIDLTLGQNFCESVAVFEGPAVSDMVMYQQARDELAAALAEANAAGEDDYALWAQAGLARAELYLGNFAAADAAATAVLANAPAGWEKLALYEAGTATNWIANISAFGFNHASGIRRKWWPYVDDSVWMMNDPLSRDWLAVDEPDSRVMIRHEDGVLGVDGVTEFYSQWKYTEEGADIPLTHLDEMRLIQAEAAWATNDLPGAMTILNGLRAAVGLSPVAAATSADVFTVLLNERFAELFMEGHRMNDIHRFGVVPAMMTAGDFHDTDSPRATKAPLSGSEGLNNPLIEDDAAVRCTPLATAG